MQARTRSLDVALFVLAILGPVFHLAGIMTRGVTLLHAEYSRVGITYVVLALSAAAAAYLSLRRGPALMRILTATLLLVNIGSIAYIGNAWSQDMQRAFAEVEMVPIASGKIGILVSPASNTPRALQEARDLQGTLNNIIEQSGLDLYIVVQHGLPVTSEEQALRVGERMRANVVIWKTEMGRELITEAAHVTVLGASETALTLEAPTLMRLMSTQQSIVLRSTRSVDEKPPYDRTIIAPVACGFAFLAAGDPMLAAAQFSSALKVPELPANAMPHLHNAFGIALLHLDREDLATQQFETSNEIKPNAQAWAGIGNAALMRRDWPMAEAAYERALALDPYTPAPYCGQGILMARVYNVRRAVSSYRQAIALAPNSAVPHTLMGMAHELEGNVDAARESYQAAAMHAGPNTGLQLAVLERAEQILRNPPTAVPTATPLPTPTLTPIPTEAMYIVQRGDTLSVIASEHGVSVDDIVALNELRTDDFLSVGQMLIIPETDE